MLIGAPLVSGFASMAGCHDNENSFQAVVSVMPSAEYPPGVDDPSTLTCSVVASMVDDFCNPNDPGMTDLVCAGSCQYHGPCTGDGALAVLFSDDDDDGTMTCSMLPAYEAAIASAYGGADVPPEAIALMPTMLSIAREICGLPPASRRARKMTDAPPVSKVHKLAAAMLRSTKTMAHRLAQVAVSQPPRRTPPARLPARPRARPRARPSPRECTL